MSASARVFDTSELLETILLELPMLDLLLSQRVCKLWDSVIGSSVRLRRALFMEPAACGLVNYIDWRLDDKGYYERAGIELGEHLQGPNRDKAPTTYAPHWGRTRNDVGRFRVFVNPLLTKFFPVLRTGVYCNETVKTLPIAMQYTWASWRFMFFTQPPIDFMAVQGDSKPDDPDTDWTTEPFRRRANMEGYSMLVLLYNFERAGRPAWIEGQHLWEEWEGSHDLDRIVVKD